MLIALEGIDGSGKGTQAQRLVGRLRETGVSTELVSFPRYAATTFGAAIGEFLNGAFGSLDEVHPFLASLLYAGDRFESKAMLLNLAARNDVVVLDRYVASNLAHQGAKLEGPARRALLDRIERVEHDLYGMPRAELTLLLDVPPETAQTLIARKDRREYTEKAADLQEADGRYLTQVHQVYRELCDADTARWRRIECAPQGRLRDVEEIAEEIGRVVANFRKRPSASPEAPAGAAMQ